MNLKNHYQKEIAPNLKEKLGYKSIMEVPKLEKITINIVENKNGVFIRGAKPINKKPKFVYFFDINMKYEPIARTKIPSTVGHIVNSK